MNKLFKQYCRSSAFRLDLSERMIEALLERCGFIDDNRNFNMHPYQALARTGLVVCDSDGCKPTEAGRKVADLLVIAGFY